MAFVLQYTHLFFEKDLLKKVYIKLKLYIFKNIANYLESYWFYIYENK